MKIPELLAPAGNMEKAIVAMAYGADAIYLAGKAFGMRAKAGNFSQEELQEVLALAHVRGVMVYVTVNIFAHNDEIDLLPAYLEELEALGVDGIIVADVGVFPSPQACSNTPVHLSTQANTVNYQAARFWGDVGFPPCSS